MRGQVKGIAYNNDTGTYSVRFVCNDTLVMRLDCSRERMLELWSQAGEPMEIVITRNSVTEGSA